MKKVLAITLSLVFVLFAFAGCGSSSSNKDVELAKVLSDVNDNGNLSSMKTISNTKDLQNSQYDIEVAHSILENYYLDIVNKKGL